MQECGFFRFEWEEEIDLQILTGIGTLDQDKRQNNSLGSCMECMQHVAASFCGNCFDFCAITT